MIELTNIFCIASGTIVAFGVIARAISWSGGQWFAAIRRLRMEWAATFPGKHQTQTRLRQPWWRPRDRHDQI